MSSRGVIHARKKLDDPGLSCGREIDVSNRGHVFHRKRAWWPCGPAMDRFDKEVMPEIEAVLRNLGLGEADVYVRLYMIGSRPSHSRPIIMLCCTNREIRSAVEKEIRRSRVPEAYPEYGLGASTLPLEQAGLAHPLAGAESGEKSATPGDVQVPLIGRRIRILLSKGPSPRVRLATGGALIYIGTRGFQLTSCHAGEDVPLPPSTKADLEDFHFDGMSDDEEDEEEDDSDTISLSELDMRATSRESLTPGGEIEWDSPGNPSVSSTESSRLPAPSRPSHTPTPQRLQPEEITILKPMLLYSSRNGPHPGLDYALLPAGNYDMASNLARNRVTVWQGDHRRDIPIPDAAAVGTRETEVIVVTASGGATYGVLMPGATYLRDSSASSFQKLYAIRLGGTIEVGDSGSAVIDEKTGHLYGHIVRGVPGTATAYMVAATEVLDDLRQRVPGPIGLSPVDPTKDSTGSLPASQSGPPDVAQTIALNNLAFERNASLNVDLSNDVAPGPFLSLGNISSTSLAPPFQFSVSSSSRNSAAQNSPGSRARTPERGSARSPSVYSTAESHLKNYKPEQ